MPCLWRDDRTSCTLIILLTVGIAAAIMRVFRRVPIVYDVQDLWPDSLRATGMLTNTRALWLIGRICRLVYRAADRIVVLSPGFKERLLQRGVPREKLSIIYNWSAEDALRKGASALEDESPLFQMMVTFVFCLRGIWVRRRRLNLYWKLPTC